MTGTGLARVVGLLAGLSVLPACTSPGIACTDIGAASGIGVTVVSAIAPDVQTLALKICRGQACRVVPVDLAPGSVTVGETCSGPGPDDVCSASASPDGSKVGFRPCRRPGRGSGDGHCRLSTRRQGADHTGDPGQRCAGLSERSGLRRRRTPGRDPTG